MNTIIIQPADENELKLIELFISNNNLKSHTLSEDDKEDFILSKLMAETDYNDIINTDDFLKNLRG